MLIIVEGPDGTGKSTLVEELRLKMKFRGGISVLKADRPRKHPLDEYVTPLLDLEREVGRITNGMNVICDRWHLGELVYPTVLDRPTQLTDPVFRYVEMFLASRGALVVRLTDDSDELEAVLRRRGDDLVLPEQAKLMLQLFDETATCSTLPTLRVPARTADIKTLQRIFTAAEHVGRQAYLIRKLATYVGAPFPKYLLVGDVRGGDPVTHGLKPAFMPYPNSCGEYLMKSVLSATRHLVTNRRLENAGIVNANDVDDLRSAWARLGAPAVIPLGRLAEKTVRAELPAQAAVESVPHPQYWKRFHHRDHLDYGKMITGSWS